MRQLRERITQHFNLAPLKAGEVSSYIEFRLRAAGYHGPNPFTARAVDMIARISEGLSRRTTLADKALLAAYSGGSHQVDVAEVKVAGQDARFAPIQQKITGQAGAGHEVGAGRRLAASPSPPLACALWPRAAADTAAAAPPRQRRSTTGCPRPRPTAPAAEPATACRRPPTSALITQHMALYSDWLAKAGGDRFFIQLTARSAGHAEDIEGFWPAPASGSNPRNCGSIGGAHRITARSASSTANTRPGRPHGTPREPFRKDTPHASLPAPGERATMTTMVTDIRPAPEAAPCASMPRDNCNVATNPLKESLFG